MSTDDDYERAEAMEYAQDLREEEVAKLRAELAAAVKRERETREVLEDLAHEKGLPEWLAAVVDEREALTALLERHRSHAEYDDYRRQCCGSREREACKADCVAARFHRMLDPVETKRQVDLAHDDALREHEGRANERAWYRVTEATFSVPGTGGETTMIAKNQVVVGSDGVAYTVTAVRNGGVYGARSELVDGGAAYDELFLGSPEKVEAEYTVYDAE